MLAGPVPGRDAASMRRSSSEVWAALPQPFLVREAEARGLAASTVRAAAGRGDLAQLAPGLYTEVGRWSAAGPRTRHLGLTCAATRATSETMASHWSAAVLLGAPVPRRLPREVALTTLGPMTSRTRPDWQIVHRPRTGGEHLRHLRGIPVTAWARTVVDAARHLDPVDGLAIADHALREGEVTSAELEVVRQEQVRWPGVARAEAVLALADSRRESWLESASAWVIESLGWPRPVPQVWLYRADGTFLGRVDSLWPGIAVAGEADGQSKYAMAARDTTEAGLRRHVAAELKAERAREREIEVTGIAVARWGAVDLERRGRALDLELRRAAARARPERVDVWWRLERGQLLRPWTDLVRLASDLATRDG